MGLHDQCQVLGGLSFFNSRFSLDRTLAVTPYLLPLLDVYLLTPEKFVESDMGGGSVVQMKLYYESVQNLPAPFRDLGLTLVPLLHPGIPGEDVRIIDKKCRVLWCRNGIEINMVHNINGL